MPALTPAEGLTAVGAAVVAASVFIPWYGIPFSNGRSVTALDSFGFAHAALLLTVAAAVWLVFRRARGHTLARPLDAGRLVAVAGGWAALLTVFLIFDRPEELGRVGAGRGAPRPLLLARRVAGDPRRRPADELRAAARDLSAPKPIWANPGKRETGTRPVPVSLSHGRCSRCPVHP